MAVRNAVKGSGVTFLVFFGLFWSAITLAFDGFIVNGLLVAQQAQSYVEGQAEILESSVKIGRGSEGGRTYSPEIRYRFSHGGQVYESDRVAPMNWSTNHKDGATRAVERFAKGTAVPVFYDRDDPEKSLLDREVPGALWFMIIFLTPFNLVMVGIWYGVIQGLRGKGVEDEGVFLKWDDGSRHFLRLATGSVWMTFGLFFGLGAFFTIFILGFATGMNPSADTALATLVGLFSVSFVLARVYKVRRERGDYDLVWDRLAKTLNLPRKVGKTLGVLYLDARQIESLDVVMRKMQKNYQAVYRVALKLNDGRDAVLQTQASNAQVDELTGWLQKHLAVPLSGDDWKRVDEGTEPRLRRGRRSRS